MKKVITYGTFDHLHEGHINILKLAKELGDYLFVGVTTENFDISRGKINVEQSLTERIEAVRSLGIANEIFPEEYVGQKIDDIKRYNIDVFTVGSDWTGKFDYLKEYCEVIYLPRTEGISSTQIRSEKKFLIGAVGANSPIVKVMENSKFINGLVFNNAFFDEKVPFEPNCKICDSFENLLKTNDIIYIASSPEKRYEYIKKSLKAKKHVISESPIALSENEAKELYNLANTNGVKLFDSIKTAFLLSFSRMILMIKGGIIGDVKSIEATCTSLEVKQWLKKTKYYTSMTGWAAFGLLPVFKILGYNYKSLNSVSFDADGIEDAFSKINILYDNSCATINVGTGVKSESDLRISGTNGYIYVPSPWWKNEYFEVRYENSKENKPFFYQSDGEGIRMELVHLINCIKKNTCNYYMDEELSVNISKAFEKMLKK